MLLRTNMDKKCLEKEKKENEQSVISSPSMSQRGRLQLNTHTPYVCGFAWSDMVHGCIVYTERAETAADSCGTSHASAVSTPLRWIFKKTCHKKAIHSCRITCERSESAQQRRTALYKSDQYVDLFRAMIMGTGYTDKMMILDVAWLNFDVYNICKQS